MDRIKIKELKIHSDDKGYLFETLRNDDELFDGKFGQALISVVYPNVIKGLHKHEKQTDYTVCVRGNCKYCVVKEENGKVEVKTFFIGEKNPVMIKIPPGLWHGYMPLGNERATILHLMDKSYDVNDPDTERLDVYAFGDVWTVKPS